jgi:hypothetical protein
MGGHQGGIKRELGSFEAAGSQDVGLAADLQLKSGGGVGQHFIGAGVGGGERRLGLVAANKHHVGEKEVRRQGADWAAVAAERFHEGGDRRRVGGDH